jgi:hypothetical protein
MGAVLTKRTDLVTTAVLLVAGDRVHQRRTGRAQRGCRRGCPRRHDPHVVGERAGREEHPAAARSLRAVPHQGGPETQPCTQLLLPPQIQQTAALASKLLKEEPRKPTPRRNHQQPRRPESLARNSPVNRILR